MHVLFLPSWYPTSPSDTAGVFFREQAISLVSAGLEVGVLTATLDSVRSIPSRGRLRRLVTFEYDEGVQTMRVAAVNWSPRQPRRSHSRLAALACTSFVQYQARFGMPDLVHVHAALPAGRAALEIAKAFKVPLVYSEHRTAYSRGLVVAEELELTRNLATQARRAYAVSSPFAAAMDQILGMHTRFGVFPNSVSPLFFDADLANPLPDRTRFAHVSLLHPNKNVDGLIRCFAKAFRDQPSVSLVIGGDGPARESLCHLTRSLGLEGQVSFTGPLSRERVVRLLASSDVFVLPSRFETFGVVAAEALAMGLPVIATRCGGPEDIIADGDGALIPVDDDEALVAALKSYECVDDLDSRLARRERCRARFACEHLAMELAAEYRTVVKEAR